MSINSILKNEWLQWIDGVNNEETYETHIDINNNIYISGQSLSISVTINGTIYAGSNVNASAAAFLVKFNSSGIVIWFKWINGSSNDYSKTVTTDSAGNVYYSGYTTSSSITVPNASNTLVTYTGGASQDVFIIKFTGGGDITWLKWITGTLIENSYKLKTDSGDNLYICGTSTSTTLTFNSVIYSQITGLTVPNSYLIKINADLTGTTSWFKWIAGTGDEQVYDISIDGYDNVYVCLYSNAVNLNIGGTGFSNVGVSARGITTFILKFDTNGYIPITNIRTINGNADDYIQSLYINQNTEICVAGYTTSSSLIINGTTYSRVTASNYANYILILNEDFSVKQFKWIDGLLIENAFVIKGDAYDNLYIVGTSTSTSINIGGTIFSNIGSSQEAFILKVDTNLNPLWFKWISGSGSEYVYGLDLTPSITSSNPDIYISGYNTTGSLTFQGTVYTRVGTTEGAFLLKLSQFEPIILQYSDIAINDVIMLPIKTITGTIQVNWGDGSSISNITADNPTYTYLSARPGTNSTTIQIYCTGSPTSNYFTQFGTSLSTPITNISKLTTLQNFGSFPLTSLKGAFLNATSFTTINTVNNICPLTVTDMSYMFYGASSFNQSIAFFTTTSVTNMSYMFYGATSFNQSIASFTTTSVINMSYMFYDASAFNQSVSSFITTSVTNMSNMFNGASSFNQSVATSGSIWNVSQVTNMSYMFYNALAFNLPVNTWNVSNVINMSYMFYGALVFNRALTLWNSVKVTNMSYMFYGAQAFNSVVTGMKTLLVTNMSYMFNEAIVFNQSINAWIVASVTNMSNMFNGAIAFNQDLNSWTVISVINMSNMFNGCSAFNGNITTWNTLNVSDMNNMFTDAILFNRDISGWNTSSVTKMNAMFKGATSFNQLLTTSGNNWNTSIVTTTYNMFSGATSFNQDLNSWNVSAVITMTNMFNGCSIFNQNLNNWNVSAVTNMSNMFSYATNFNGDISYWDVSSVNDMSYMFYYASAFNQSLNLWTTINVTNMNYMFSHATSFNKPLNSWNVSAVTSMIDMFNTASAFNQPLNSWNVSLVTTMTYMFYNAGVFNQPLNSWNVSNVLYMTGMFYGANNFNQNLSNWNVSNVITMTDMLTTSGLSNVNYTYTLIGWASLPSLQSSVPLGATSKQYYTNAISSKSYLTSTKGWTITDGGALTTAINPIYGSPFRYYKWIISRNSNLPIQASELLFYNYYKVPISLSAITITNPGGNNPVGNEPSKLIDNNYFTMWIDETISITSTILLDFGTNYITIEKPYYYSWITSNDDIGIDPSTWTLYGSNNIDAVVWSTLNQQSSYVSTTTRNTETTLSVDGENYFTFTYPTQSPLQLQYTVVSPSDLTIILPLSGTVNLAVNWGDTKYDAYTTSGEKTHTYSSSGIYTVEINGLLTQFGLGNSTYLYAPLLTTVLSFGEIGLSSLSGSFYGASSLTSIPATLPIKSSITDLSQTFKNCIVLNDANITKWDISSVIDMSYLFYGCIDFNQDVSKWSIYKTTNMSHMFTLCSHFNQNISNWNVSFVTNMSYMLSDCDIFNQDLSTWKISNVTNFDHFLHNTPISTTNYNNILINWVNSNPQNTVNTFYADLTKYSYGAASEGRYKLTVSPYQWTIIDGGIDETTLPTSMSLEYHVIIDDLTITLPLYGIVDVIVDWGDFTTNSYTTTGNKTHTYASAGTYTVLIKNRLTQFGNGSSYTNANRLYKVNSFGEIGLTSLRGAFYNATNLTEVPTSLPSTNSNITDLSYTFYGATSFNQDISNWNVSTITTMTNMFTNITLSTTNYNLLLNTWSLLSLQNNVDFHAGSSKYSYGLTTISRNKIINNYNWTITDDGQDSITIPPSSTMVLVYTVPSNSKTITLPFSSSNNSSMNIYIDFGDLNTTHILTNSDVNYTYSTAGTYLVKITGTLKQFGNGPYGYTNPTKLERVLSFGNLGIISLSGSFYNCSNLVEVPTSIPITLTNLEYGFYNCSSFNDINITNWNMTNITNINKMFYNATQFNQNIFLWNVPNLIHFEYILYYATSFHIPLSGWLLTELNKLPRTLI